MTEIIERAEGLRRLSVIIPNYNYGRFLDRAISSALAVDWPDLEVIVVDDGSTDDSVSVAAGFGERITLLQQENAGPREACNRGYAASTGDVVVFLDSDDLLDPALAREISTVMRPGVSKVQVQMQRIDESGIPRREPFPEFRRVPDSRQLRSWLRRSSSYPTPPGSGNAYSRAFLEELFPLDDRCGDATDSACLAAAPLLGDVVTIAKPLASYRQHGQNRSFLLADQEQFRRQLERALQRHEFVQELDGRRDEAGWLAPLFRSRHVLQLRVAQARIARGPVALPGDGRPRMVLDALRNVLTPGLDDVPRRVSVSLWCLAVLWTPERLARRLIRWRYRQPA